MEYQYRLEGEDFSGLKSTTVDEARDEVRTLVLAGDWGQDEDGYAGETITADLYERAADGEWDCVEELATDIPPTPDAPAWYARD